MLGLTGVVSAGAPAAEPCNEKRCSDQGGGVEHQSGGHSGQPVHGAREQHRVEVRAVTERQVGMCSECQCERGEPDAGR